MATNSDSDFDYKLEVDRMFVILRLLVSVDLKGIINAIQVADTVGPFVDPTMYRDALRSGTMHKIERLARDLIPIKELTKEFIENELANDSNRSG